MVRDIIIEIEIDKPEPVKPLGQGGHEFPLGADIVEDQQEHQLENDRRGYGNMAVYPISGCNLLINKIKIHQLLDLAQGVIRAHPLLQTQPLIKHFKLSAFGLSPHHRKDPHRFKRMGHFTIIVNNYQ